jgi:hypothetical protein
MKNQVWFIIAMARVRDLQRRSSWRRGFVFSAFALSCAVLAVAQAVRPTAGRRLCQLQHRGRPGCALQPLHWLQQHSHRF